MSRIAYIDIQGRLVTCSGQGDEETILTRPGRVYQFPAWSPNGEWIAAIGSDQSGIGVYLFADDVQGEQYQLYRSGKADNQSPFYLYWSPDSRSIGFIATNSQLGIGFHLIDVANRTARLVSGGQPFFWQWDWDSAEILVHAGIGEAGQLSLLDPQNDQLSPNFATPGYFQTPGISASGAFMAYSRLNAEGRSVLIIEDRITDSRVSHPHEGAVAFSWNPQEDHIAFISPEQDSRHFYGPLHIMLANGHVSELTRQPVVGFMWSPDGHKLAYFVPRTDDVLESAEKNGLSVSYVNGAAPPKMTRQEPQSNAIRLELWIADFALSTREKIYDFKPSPLFLNQLLPFFDQYALSHKLWSANSDALLLSQEIADKNEVVAISALTGDPLFVKSGFMAFWKNQ